MSTEVILYTLTLIIGLYMAWNIGANDVSNAMGTSVGSKALTLKKAVIIAGVLEFGGAYFLGSHVSKTLQQGIINPNVFASDRMIFIFGMLGALFATGIWLNLASYLRLPVSTTHAIVGSVLGFGVIIGGMEAIHWMKVLSITLGWILSPVFSGVISYFIFLLIQRKIFYAFNPFESTKQLVPFLVFFAFTFFSISLIFNGFGNLNIYISFPIALISAIAIGLIGFVITVFILKKVPLSSLKSKICAHPHQMLSLEKAAKHLERIKLAAKGDVQSKASAILKDVNKLKNEVKAKNDYSKVSDEYREVEKVFAYLQIISACMVAFAHGANDVANAIGPVSAIVHVLQYNVVDVTSNIPSWILLLGGAGIILGLATWGWRVIETIGNKITELTPTRGFSAEFGAALTILLASRMGLPISTTHALVGSVLGVGIARGIRALNLKVLKDIVLSWVITIPICAILSILSFYLLKAFF